MKTSRDENGKLHLTYTEEELRALKVSVLDAVTRAMKSHLNTMSSHTSYEMCRKDGYSEAVNHIAVTARSLSEST